LGLAEHPVLEENPNPGKSNDYYRIKDANHITELEDNSLFTFITTTVDSDSRIKNFSCVKI
jgi:hypothetical protein